MNIFPINAEAAKKRHWVVRWLRAYAIIEVVLAVLAGLIYSYNLFTPMVIQSTGMDPTICAVLVLVLGGLVSFAAGLAISLPFWALATVIDDLHALRLYAQGLVVMDDRGNA